MNKAILHVLTPIIAAVILNAYIYAKGWNKTNTNKCKKCSNKYLPPGYVIAIVWIIILGLLGYTHYLLYPSNASIFVILSILYCLAYPFLTEGLNASKAFIYNVISFVLATILFAMAFIQKQEAAIYVTPFVLWTSYVNIVT